MQHAAARTALAGVLQSGWFDGRAMALIQAAGLQGNPSLEASAAALVLDSAQSLPLSHPGQIPGEPLIDPLPETENALASQLAAALAAHPVSVAQNLGSLQALLQLWPHASRTERLQLRRAWHVAMLAAKAPREAVLTCEQLCAWQRNQPTQHGTEQLQLSDLSRLLDQSEPEAAHHVLGQHLSPGADLKRLGWVMGALAQQFLLHRFDRRGWCLHALQGAVAWSCLLSRLPPELAVTLISQLAHELWWIARHGHLVTLRPGSNEAHFDLARAVGDADCTAAQRVSRQLAREAPRFWRAVCEVLIGFIRSGNDHWPRALGALSATLCRANGHPISPDDAAALGAALAAVEYLCHGHFSGGNG